MLFVNQTPTIWANITEVTVQLSELSLETGVRPSASLIYTQLLSLVGYFSEVRLPGRLPKALGSQFYCCLVFGPLHLPEEISLAEGSRD